VLRPPFALSVYPYAELIVNDIVRSPLAAWESFYIIVGSCAGALTGLQFVVMALVADSRTATTPREIAAFGTPTILHFCAALLVSALLSAPWGSLQAAGLSLAACGVAGVAYVSVVVSRARRQHGYLPVLEDWIWHAVLPMVAYAGLLTAGILLPRSSGPALSCTAVVSLLLVFVGIHNAWDTVTYIAVDLRQGPEQARAAQRRRRR
jgi:hypothetical protein